MFLKEMLERIQAVDLSKFNADDEFGDIMPGDELVGVIPENIRKIYVAVLQHGEEVQKSCPAVHKRMAELKQSRKEGNIKMPEKADLELIQGHALAHDERDLFRDYFWICVKRHFNSNYLITGNLSLRKGWEVVSWCDEIELLRTLIDITSDHLSEITKKK